MATHDSTPLKKCSKCGEEYPRTSQYFYRSKQQPSGFRPDCKACNNAKKQQWRDENPDKQLEIARRQSEAIKSDPERYQHKLEQGREYSRKYHHEHRERILEKMRLDYWSRREYHAERKRKHAQDSPEVRRAADKRRANSPKQIAKRHRRAARKRSLPDNFSDTDWQYALSYFQGRCAACGKSQGLWLRIVPDHWIPLADERCTGTIPTNIVPLCHAVQDGYNGCNNSKHARDPVEWLNARFGERRAQQILERIQAYFNSLV